MAAAVLLAVLVGAVDRHRETARCRTAAHPPPRPRRAVPPVLAETPGEEGHLTIGVVSLDRVAPDTVELRLAVTHTGRAGSPALDIAQRFSADRPDRGTLAEVYLADLSHEHKFFILRDGTNAPLGSRDLTPLAAGERRVLWARYPGPGRRGRRRWSSMCPTPNRCQTSRSGKGRRRHRISELPNFRISPTTSVFDVCTVVRKF